MNLYFTDSLGNKMIIAENISDPTKAIEKIIAHQASRFIHKSGVCKINTESNSKFTFTNATGQPSGYTLEK